MRLEPGSYPHQQFLGLFFCLGLLRLCTVSYNYISHLNTNIYILSGFCMSLVGMMEKLWVE
jgi:hypothetical protein